MVVALEQWGSWAGPSPACACPASAPTLGRVEEGLLPPLQITQPTNLWLPGVTSSRPGFWSTLAILGPAGLVERVSCLGQKPACRRSLAVPWRG